MTASLRDTYGYLVDRSRPRHPKCDCVVPCQTDYLCGEKDHVGSRVTPLCSGGHPFAGCDDCFNTKVEKEKGSHGS